MSAYNRYDTGMHTEPRMIRPKHALLTMAALVLLVGPALGQDHPARVTSDTPEYCAELQTMVRALLTRAPAPSQEASTLSVEGRRMCDQGHTRGGIMRLRRAIALIHGTAE